MGVPFFLLPDVISESEPHQVWELKPVTHATGNRQGVEQLEKYIGEVKSTGREAQKGNASRLVPVQGMSIGSIYDDENGGKEYNVQLWIGKEEGMVYYSLKPTGQERSRTERALDSVSDAMHDVVKSLMAPAPSGGEGGEGGRAGGAIPPPQPWWVLGL